MHMKDAAPQFLETQFSELFNQLITLISMKNINCPLEPQSTKTPKMDFMNSVFE